MPKLKPLVVPKPARIRVLHLVIAFAFLAICMVALHAQLLQLPFFWDEQGQFIPTALDLLRSGTWVAHSTVPNVHPPAVEVYLVLWYKVFGYSIAITRVAMLVIAGLGVLLTFLLAIELSKGTQGAPAFLPPLLLVATPLFYMQGMLAQLDMPAMVFGLLVILLYFKQEFAWAAAASVVLVLCKETGIVVPAVLFFDLARQRRWRPASYFCAAPAVLALWLVVLHHATGYWLGNPGFGHYNVEYALQPVRMAVSLGRRIYYLFFAEFRWIATAMLVFAMARSRPAFATHEWRIIGIISALTVLLVSLLGGAELERYLLPVFPFFYIAAAVALSEWKTAVRVPATLVLLIGLAANLFWKPPYPFPFENNYALVDFVRLQQMAAEFAESRFSGRTIATAWPYTASLSSPDFGLVRHKLNVVETNDFHFSSIAALPPDYTVLITFTRTWPPTGGFLSVPLVRYILTKYYNWQPEITAEQCADLGLHELVSWQMHGQQITIYLRGQLTPRI